MCTPNQQTAISGTGSHASTRGGLRKPRRDGGMPSHKGVPKLFQDRQAARREDEKHARNVDEVARAIVEGEVKAVANVDDGLSYYYIPDAKTLGLVRSRFPFLRFRNQYDPIRAKFPQDPWFVGYYHLACRTCNYLPDVASIAFKVNEIDPTQFEDQKTECVLALREDEIMFCRMQDGQLFFGVVPSKWTHDIHVIAQYGNEKQQYYLVAPCATSKLDGPQTKRLEAERALVAQLVLSVRGQPRDEKLKRNLYSKFSFACSKFGVKPDQYDQVLTEVMKSVWNDKDIVVPYAALEVILALIPNSHGSEILKHTLRELNVGGQVDAALFNAYQKKMGTTLQEFLAGLGVSPSLALGATVYDVCGEHLCSKKITYEIDSKDILLAMVQTCKPRLAYIKVGPSLEGYEPQVSRTCCHNAVNALQTRFVTDVSQYRIDEKEEYESMDLLFKTLRDMMSWSGYEFKLLTYEEFVDSMDWPASMKREAYALYPEFEGQEETWLDTQIRAFAKWEELKNKENLNSRLIQGFSLGFSLITGRVVKSLYKSLKPVVSDPKGILCIGSMMTAEQIGEWHQLAARNNEHITGLDGESYDATTRRNPVLHLYAFYQELAAMRVTGIDVLRSSLKLMGSLYSQGIKYRLPHQMWEDGWAPMASGRADTTLTNSLLRAREGLWYLHVSGQKGSVIASGDDLNVRHFDPIDFLAGGRSLGRVEKIECTSNDQAVFLRRLMYPVGRKLIPGVMIGRVMNKMAWIKGDVAAKKRLGVLKGNAIAFMSSDHHVPILSEYCERLIELTQKVQARKPEQSYNRLEYKKSHSYDDSTVDFICRRYNFNVGDVREMIDEIKVMRLEDDFNHWGFGRMFDIDVGSAASVRSELRTSVDHTILPVLAWTSADIRGWVYLIYVCMIAPLIEELGKLHSGFFGVLSLVLLESVSTFGFFIPEVLVRLFLHQYLTGLARQDFLTAVALHMLHNIATQCGGTMFFFMPWVMRARRFCDYVQLGGWVVWLLEEDFPQLTARFGQETQFGKFNKLIGRLYISYPGAFAVHLAVRGSFLAYVSPPRCQGAYSNWQPQCSTSENLCLSLLWKMPDVFTSIRDCLGILNNRITRLTTSMVRTVHFIIVKFRTRKNNKKNSNKQQNSKKKKGKGSLGRTLATTGLGALGTAFGGAPGAAIGSQVGSFLSDILGMGDYEVKVNSLSTQGSVMPATAGVPTFHSSTRSVRVRHREYLQDITGSTGFSLQAWNINPGLLGTFPWLSGLAESFQSYKFHGLVFEFWSTSADALNSTNTALGTVIMATQSNAARANFVSKAEMEQYEFATSSKPSMSMIHPVECAPGEAVLDELYIRTGTIPAGEVPQFYDFGKFQLATTGMQAAANIGELWVSYDVELYKPRISPGVYAGDYYRLNNGPYDATNYFGLIQTTSFGNIGATISATGAGYDTITIPAAFSTGAFLINVTWTGTAAANCVMPTVTTANLTGLNRLKLSSTSVNQGPGGGTSNSNVLLWQGCYSINGYSSTGSTIRFSAGTLPGSPADLDVFIVGIPTTESFI